VVGFVKQHVACEIMVSFMCRTGNVRETKTTFSYVLVLDQLFKSFSWS